MQALGSNTLKPYMGSSPGRTDFCMARRCPDPAGSKASVFLPNQPQPASVPASVRQGR